MRADAEDNRRALLDAARSVFLEEGPSVALDRIAKRAGVGIGTLYRRFPDRDALLVGVLTDVFGRMVQAAREVARRADLDGAGGPARAWEDLVHAMIGLAIGPVIPIIVRERTDLVGHPEVRAGIQDVIDTVGGVYRRAQDAGGLRPDVSFLEVQILAGLLTMAGNSRPPDADPQMLLARLTAIVLDGLRAGPHTSVLPGVPTDYDPLAADAGTRQASEARQLPDMQRLLEAQRLLETRQAPEETDSSRA